MNEKSEWLCDKCEVGILDPDKKVRSPKNRIEAVVICPECGAENPVWSFTNDPDSGLRIPEDNIKLIVMKYYIFELVCRKCAEKLECRLTQFDELPNCPKCGNEMLVENVTAIESDIE